METNELIKQYYEMENAVMVSPHALRGRMDRGDTSFILADLRSAEEFGKARIRGAINIPAYSSPETPAYHETARIVSAFQALQPNTEIILYCYSKACMTGRKIGLTLAQNDIYARHLAIGWNEWFHNWENWNHEHDWEKTRREDYIEGNITSGTAIGCRC